MQIYGSLKPARNPPTTKKGSSVRTLDKAVQDDAGSGGGAFCQTLFIRCFTCSSGFSNTHCIGKGCNSIIEQARSRFWASVGVFFLPSFGCDFSSKIQESWGLDLKILFAFQFYLSIAKDWRNGCFWLVDYDDCNQLFALKSTLSPYYYVVSTFMFMGGDQSIGKQLVPYWIWYTVVESS